MSDVLLTTGSARLPSAGGVSNQISANGTRDRVSDNSLDKCAQLLPSDARFWLAATFHASDDAVIGTDMNGVVTSWNRMAESMFGFTPAEIAGQPINRIIPPDK